MASTHGKVWSYGNHRNLLSKNVFELLLSRDYSDVTFVINGRKVKGHKCILAARCAYFEKMFNFESKKGERNSEIVITTMSYDIFKAIVSFIYRGQVWFPSDITFARNLLENADMMDLGELKEVIIDYYMSILTSSNCLGIDLQATKYNARRLEKSVQKYALKIFEIAIESRDFVRMPDHVIKCYLGHHDVNAVSEETICLAALKWIKHAPEERAGQTLELLCEMRLTNLDAYFIESELRCDAIIKKSPETIDLLQNVLKHILYLKSEPTILKCKFPRTKINIVTGLTMISSTGDVHLLHFESKSKLSYKKKQELESQRPYLDICSSALINDILFVSTKPILSSSLLALDERPQVTMYKYELYTQQWIVLSREMFQYIILFSGEGNKLYGLTYKFVSGINKNIVLLSVMKYVIGQNKWCRILSFETNILSSERNITVFSYGKIVYIFGVSTGGNQIENRTGVMVVDLIAMKETFLNISLPQKLTQIQSVVHRSHVIVSGVEDTFICSLPLLEEAYKQQNEQDSEVKDEEKGQPGSSNEEPTTLEFHQPDNDVQKTSLCNEAADGRNEQQKPPNSSLPNDCWFVSKNVDKGPHKLVKLGNQLILIKGVKNRYNVPRTEILAANLEDFIAGKMETELIRVCVLPDRYALGKTFLAAARFSQFS